MRSLPDIKALNDAGATPEDVNWAVDRYVASISDGQLLLAAQRRGLILDGAVTTKGAQALASTFGNQPEQHEIDLGPVKMGKAPVPRRSEETV